MTNYFLPYRFEIEIEPTFVSMALYDLKEKKKVRKILPSQWAFSINVTVFVVVLTDERKHILDGLEMMNGDLMCVCLWVNFLCNVDKHE